MLKKNSYNLQRQVLEEPRKNSRGRAYGVGGSP